MKNEAPSFAWDRGRLAAEARSATKLRGHAVRSPFVVFSVVAVLDDNS